MRDVAAIVGIGHTEFSKNIGRPERTLAIEAITAALDDAGLTPADVDGTVKFTLENTMEVEIARNLGIPNLRYFGDVAYGGGAGCGAIGHAAMAIAAGMADCIVVWRARNRGSGGRPWAAKGNQVGGEMQWYLPFGLSRPVDQIAMLARRHMIEYGSTPEQLAAVATTFRAHAQNNPDAMMRAPMTVEDYFASRFVSEPLRLFDCCLESDGALAIVLTSAERARDLRKPPVLVRGFAQATGPDHTVMANYFTADPLESPGHYAARDLWRNAGMSPDEIDVVQVYDAFSPLVPISLEAYGFCKPGEGGPLAASGALRVDGGSLPCNTSGGSLSEAYVHGMNLIVEGVRQLRGTSVNQVDAQTCMVTSGNGVPTSALVLRKP
ncbi:MAG TPA: lipid-transfer protein [Actinomycetota bacterium]|nr:lipid-transfer protein [Actinomycetota bacterium]